MGLDMYLRANRYISEYDGEDVGLATKVAKLLGAIPGGTVSGISLRVGYWRKANAIHKWFVDNVQGGEDECRAHGVSKEQLEVLYNLCLKILAKRGTKIVNDLIEDFLPPSSGFFFGSTDVDDYYFADLENTVKQLKPLIEFTDTDWDYEYQSSW